MKTMIGIAGVMIATAASGAALAQDFYKDRQINMLVASGVGGWSVIFQAG